MQANKYISKREHKLLLLVTFLSFSFVFTVFACQVFQTYYDFIVNISPQFSGGAGAFRVPGLHLLTLFIFIALLKTKRFLLPSFLTVLYTFVFIYGLSVRYKAGQLGGEEFSPKVAFLDQVFRAANSFDYLAAFFISILLFWQISILLRMLIKTLQKETALP